MLSEFEEVFSQPDVPPLDTVEAIYEKYQMKDEIGLNRVFSKKDKMSYRKKKSC